MIGRGRGRGSADFRVSSVHVLLAGWAMEGIVITCLPRLLRTRARVRPPPLRPRPLSSPRPLVPIRLTATPLHEIIPIHLSQYLLCSTEEELRSPACIMRTTAHRRPLRRLLCINRLRRGTSIHSNNDCPVATVSLSTQAAAVVVGWHPTMIYVLTRIRKPLLRSGRSEKISFFAFPFCSHQYGIPGFAESRY